VQSEAGARAAADTVVTALCPGSGDPIACLRGLPAANVAAITVTTVDPVIDGYWPWQDGDLFPEPLEQLLASGKAATTPLIIGTNRSEWLLWQALGATPPPVGSAGLRAEINRYFPAHAERIAAHYVPASEFDVNEAFLRLMTDAYFRCPSRALMRGANAAGGTGYLYDFAVHPAAHALEVDYVFDLPAVSLLFPFEAPDPLLPNVVRAMQGYWTQFAATGDPNRGGMLAWPRYAAPSDQHVVFDDPVAVGSGLARAECDLWDALWGVEPSR
jgi:para-nitrobenzyl esterase